MAEWSEDHVVAIGCLNLTLAEFVEYDLTGDRGGGLRWKVGTVGWKGRRVTCEKLSPPRL
jgi:hypothetical protein